MTKIKKCDCADRMEISINSIALFEELKSYFEEEVKKKTFVEQVPAEPYFIWKDKGEETKEYASKWYKCRKCGCLWEFNYPDFPAKGFVRKFPDGAYAVKEVSSSDDVPFRML